ncbi:MAG: hypothetical protein GEU77_13490 [Deltaproteobacteria bacterium]|nr:hypothetical protein [Deltaproteobacteria bacterium]
MKRILVIDESEVVRETLALILGREFSVVKRLLGTAGFSLADTGADVDLMILGVNPGLRSEAGKLLRFAAQVPCAVLFLVDSRSATKLIEERETVGCLAKPFNPYELKQKVGTLLARTAVLPRAQPLPVNRNNQLASRYLTFPFLTRTAACLVHRFASTRLPVLISGEIGCGQERVIRGMRATAEDAVPYFFVNAAEIDGDYLAEKHAQLSWQSGHAASFFAVEDIDKLPVSGQSALLNFIQELDSAPLNCRVLATSKVDLLERVYQGDFLEGLYYRIATLTLKLPPLRDRRDDIPAIVDWFAHHYSHLLELDEVTFSVSAKEQLCNYLWFGNLNEMETVVARTLALRRKSKIEAADLVFDFSDAIGPQQLSDFERLISAEESELATAGGVRSWRSPRKSPTDAPSQVNGNGKGAELKVLIHELAHEMKNPMVTIKTFAQLLGDRYQDENFRERFQEVVGGDIERMDDLLEVMIEFADFSQPNVNRVSLEERLRSSVDEVGSECAKRQAFVRWQGNEFGQPILADEGQLAYILKNVLLAILSQVKMGSEVNIDVAGQGTAVISYSREGARMASITQYLGSPSEGTGESILPLRLMLAKQLVERNGGGMAIDSSDSEKEILRMEFPIA